MEVRVLTKIFLLLSTVLFLGFFFEKKQKPLPLIQRGIVNEVNAIVYIHPDFDANQIATIPRNKIVAISTEIYRPKNLFGSFYRIFLNKPKKIKGYISEVDVVPQYTKNKKGWAFNSFYKEKETNLKQVQKKSSIMKSHVFKKTDSSPKSQVIESENTASKDSVKESSRSQNKEVLTQEPMDEKGLKEEYPRE